MAIKISVTDQYGATHPEAYAKILTFSGSNNNASSSVNYTVAAWISLAAKDAGFAPIMEDRYEELVINLTELSIAGLYNNLVTQDKYKSGVAV